ncbi:Kynurenine 3-monooxygenase [Pandoraea iniqua]|uniref:Flavin-dependent monooxygenase n=1 Tax=Pandoraea iniqua TaxID=2508288 RepID=A0A5E4XZ23_9BURK|nr:NAD(P)/FAD-dependent oxidoreductase [Pandoraea iniqua]VVE41590.1 Kynurenine 3-monooxygenase [Pandoraea iniqua]
MSEELIGNDHLSRGHLLHHKTIAIIGGGPAGLTLARLLQLQGVEVHVFERDASSSARSQGGSLDLHVGSGQLALQRCGLTGQFAFVARPDGQATKVIDRHGRVLASSAGENEDFQPEVDRAALRDLLLHSLIDGTVAWGHSLQSLKAESNGRHRLVFASGKEFVADLVVGADGLRSRVREKITTTEAAYTGVTFFEVRLSDVDVKHPELARYVGPGNALALGDNKGLLAQRNGDGSIRVYVARRMSETWLKEQGIEATDTAKIRAGLLEWFTDWAPMLVEMIRQSDERVLPWPLYACPPDQKWETRSGLTIIGDAAHVMPPFLGAGANMAMLDAVELADHLASNHYRCLDDALAKFELGMRDRMAPIIAEAVATQDVLFNSDAPAALVDVFNGANQ